MKKNRIFILLIGLLITVSSFALGKDSLHAVTMVLYEQGFMDSEGTLALKNNTSQAISNVTFRITYLDMKGREMDYEDYSLKVDIGPGLTKKVDVDAYEHDRYYSYYKSEAYPLGAHRFKVKFELLGYNSPRAKMDNADFDEESQAGLATASDGHAECGLNPLSMIIWFILAGLILAFYIGIYILVASMARARHRNVAFWVIASFIGTPFTVVVILWFIGDADDGE